MCEASCVCCFILSKEILRLHYTHAHTTVVRHTCKFLYALKTITYNSTVVTEM